MKKSELQLTLDLLKEYQASQDLIDRFTKDYKALETKDERTLLCHDTLDEIGVPY